MDPKMREAFARKRREAPEKTLEFFRAFEPSAVGPALASAREVVDRARVRDSVYRIFHRSFKMYRLRDVALELVEAMLAPVGFRQSAEALAPETIVEALRRWSFDELFVDLVAAMARTRFTKERNEPTAWAEDARQLAAGLLVIREVSLASLEAMLRMTRGEGFLFHELALDPTDALFLETWAPLGLVLRHMRPEGVEEECRQLLLGKRPDTEDV
jgi:hypothetical protein